MQVQVPDMFGSELAAALDFDGGANNLINLIQNNLIKVGAACLNALIYPQAQVVVNGNETALHHPTQ